MSPVGHFAVGFAAKRVAPEIYIGFLLLSTWIQDILFFIFMFAGMEHIPPSTFNSWSHGLFMSVIWSILAGLITVLISRNFRISMVIGLLVFSHWVLDFISWDYLQLFFNESPKLGLGLYNSVLHMNRIA